MEDFLKHLAAEHGGQVTQTYDVVVDGETHYHCMFSQETVDLIENKLKKLVKKCEEDDIYQYEGLDYDLQLALRYDEGCQYWMDEAEDQEMEIQPMVNEILESVKKYIKSREDPEYMSAWRVYQHLKREWALGRKNVVHSNNDRDNVKNFMLNFIETYWPLVGVLKSVSAPQYHLGWISFHEKDRRFVIHNGEKEIFHGIRKWLAAKWNKY